MKPLRGMGDPKIDRFRARRRWARILGWIFYSLLFTGFLAVLGVAGFIYVSFIKDLPDYQTIRDYRPPVVTTMFTRDGRLMGEFCTERRIEVPYSRLPRHLVMAFVAAEDTRFFEHPGVDIPGIIRAFIRNVEAGEIVQGGSTITQQLVKRIMLSSEKSFGRKVKEAVLAYRIDKYLTKEEILTLYLNHIFLGRGAYGVEAAAQEFFSKHVEDLTLAESTILAGIPKAPSRYSPHLNPQKAKERQAYVLRRMAEVGFITQAQADEALRQPVKLKSMRPDWLKECGYFTEHVRGLLEERFGKDRILCLGLKVYTTADVGLHKVAQAAINRGMDDITKRNGYEPPMRQLQKKEIAGFQQRQFNYFRKYPPRKNLQITALVSQAGKKGQGVQIRFGEYGGNLFPLGSDSGSQELMEDLVVGDVVKVRLVKEERPKWWTATLEPAPMVQGAILSMEIKTGKVRTMVGGKDYSDSTFNRATQAKRQPGSAFKPIIYAAAVERGYGPNSILMDEPLSLPGGRQGEMWSPENYDHSYYGAIPMSTAVALSRNIPAVRMMMAIGVPAVVNMAKNLGITSPIYPNYSTALGSSEVTLLELTRAYAAFPNKGQLITPVFIERLEDRDGRVLFDANPTMQQVMKPESADIMTRLLLGVVERGTATRVQVLKRPIAGKTGTTNDNRDAWFIGFTPSLITGVWVGMDSELILGDKETGSQAAAPVFIDYMKEALKNQPVEQFGEGIKAPVKSRQLDDDDDDELDNDVVFREKKSVTRR